MPIRIRLPHRGGGFTIDGYDGNINNYEETQRIVYVGPSFATRLETSKFLLTASLGVGPLFLWTTSPLTE